MKKELILINPYASYYLINFIERVVVGDPVPYALFTLAALTPKEYKIRIINQKAFWSHGEFARRAGALIGITCLTSAAPQAYRLADKFRKAGARVVLGGPHASALPQEALLHADSVVVGEAEPVWNQVIADFEAGRLQKIYEGKPLEDFFTPVYDYFLRMSPSALNRIGIHIDRGCKYHCDFCARISNWLRCIKKEQVIELVRRIAEAKRNFLIRRPVISFRCDNIFSNPSYAKELFKGLIPLKVNWIANSSIDIGFDEEALRLAKESGCKAFFIGFETRYPKDFRKTSLEQLHSEEDYKTAIKNIKARGIKITGSFITGLDHYSHLDYLKLLWFLMRSGLWSFNLTILTPFPGSALFDRLKKEKRILSYNWRKYNFYFCVIRPKHTSIPGLYLWYWFIKLTICFFSPKFYLLWFYFIALLSAGEFIYGKAWSLGYYLSRRLIYGF